MFYYSLFGLTVYADLSLSLHAASQKDSFDIRIYQGIVPEIDNENWIARHPEVSYRTSELILRINGVASFYARNGEEIIYGPYDEATEINYNHIEQYILTTVLFFLMVQRKWLPLHGAALDCNGIGFMLLGKAGVGKSSLVHSAQLDGINILSEDLTCVDVYTKPEQLFPGTRSQRFTLEFVNKFGICQDTLNELHRIEHKRSAQLPELKMGYSVSFKKIFILESGDLTSVHLVELKGSEKMTILLQYVYRLDVFKNPSMISQLFEQVGVLADRCQVYRLIRPKDTWTSDQQLSLIKEQLAEVTYENCEMQ